MNEISNENTENNDVNDTRTGGKGISLSRCTIAKQDGIGRHPTNATMRRTKWSQEVIRTVIECYYRRETTLTGYRKRMHMIMKEKGKSSVKGKRLLDQT